MVNIVVIRKHHAKRMFQKVTVIGKKLRVKLASYKLNTKRKMTIHPCVRGLAWLVSAGNVKAGETKEFSASDLFHGTSDRERLAKFRLRERVI